MRRPAPFRPAADAAKAVSNSLLALQNVRAVNVAVPLAVAAWVGWERTGHRPSPKIVVTGLPRFGGNRRRTGHAVGALNSALMTRSDRGAGRLRPTGI